MVLGQGAGALNTESVVYLWKVLIGRTPGNLKDKKQMFQSEDCMQISKWRQPDGPNSWLPRTSSLTRLGRDIPALT